MKLVEREPNFDILVWWKHNSAQYSILSTVANDIFVTPVSTVVSESAFNTEGKVLETYRSSLKPEMKEALICIHNWLTLHFTYFNILNLMGDLELYEYIIAGKIITLF